MRSYLEQEQKSRIVVLLQHEFSVQIKGRALCDYDVYLKLPALKNGLPICDENDKSFVYKIFLNIKLLWNSFKYMIQMMLFYRQQVF